MVEWTPISEQALKDRIAQGEARMSETDRRFWSAIRIAPERWEQHPYGDAGNGFWAVALVGRTVLWYNDIEDGFCRSRYKMYGAIEDYWRNHDELDVAVQFLRNSIELGTDLLELFERLPKRR